LARDRVNQFIGEALMIALAMIVLDVLGDRAPEMALAELRPHVVVLEPGSSISRRDHKSRRGATSCPRV
jgi:hypothetical protein